MMTNSSLSPILASTVDLNLGSAEQPRHLLHFHDKFVLAFGGDTGIITVISSSGPKTARRFDDEPIRSLAISPDGKRVAVGFEDGSIQIFCYLSYNVDVDDKHPFLVHSNKNKRTDHQDLLTEEEDGLLTQSDDGLDTTENKEEDMFLVPRFDTPVRHLAFDPRSKGPVEYYLAIATESRPGFCIVNVASQASVHKRYLDKETEIQHGEDGVRSLAYSPKSEKMFLATLGMDGRLVVWDVSGSDPDLDWHAKHRDMHKVISKRDVGELNGSDVGDRSCVPSWSSNGKMLGLPGRADVQVRLVDHREKGWAGKQRFILSEGMKGHGDLIVCMAFSPDDSYLVTSGRDCRVMLWSVDTEAQLEDDSTPIGCFLCEIEKPTENCLVTHLHWYKREDGEEELWLVFANGSMSAITGKKNIFSLVAPSPILPEIPNLKRDTKITLEEVDDDADKAEAPVLTDSEENHIDTQPTELEDDIVLEPTETVRSPMKLTKRLTKSSQPYDSVADDNSEMLFDDGDVAAEKNSLKKTNKFIDDEADENNDVDVEEASHVPNEVSLLGDQNESKNIENHPDDQSSLIYPPQFDNNDDDYVDEDHADNNLHSYAMAAPQPPFVPSSTPIGVGSRRILCWNHIGTVTQRDEGAVNVIDISFVDSAVRRPISFTDNLNFIIGSLGDEGSIFASDVLNEDDESLDNNNTNVGIELTATKAVLKKSQRQQRSGKLTRPTGSSIYFHRFETFGPLKNKDWHLTLPDGERAVGCACGEGWAAVITSRRFLRMYSSGGMQGPVTWLKGEPVTIVGRGRFLAVIFHETYPLPDGTQKLGYSFFDVTAGKELATGAVAGISTCSSLTWAGISNDFSFNVMDSDGMLSVLVPQKSSNNTFVSDWHWSPILDTLGLRKSLGDSFWPVAVLDSKLIYVPLNGGKEHPDAVRRPVTSTLNFRMPMAQSTSGQRNALEESSIRANIALRQKKAIIDTVATDGENVENLENEYDGLCAKMDKNTIKLFHSVVETGNVEGALGLVDRLHLEKSFDIAVTVADRKNLTRLSDRILQVKDKKFLPLPIDGEDVFDEAGSAGDDNSYRTRRDDFNDTRSISPDSTKIKRTHDDIEEHNRVPRQVKQKYEEEEEAKLQPASRGRPLNPFKKKLVESPAKLSAPLSPSWEPALARTSTFSKQSRLVFERNKKYI